MRPLALVRLAFAGSRTDALRVLLTALSAGLATIAVLAAVTVLAIPELGSADAGSDAWNMRYSNALLREPGLRPGVAFALVLLTIPVLALAGQCGRLGAPARDRRLSAVRLAGATPRQAVALAAAETGLASALGVALGFATYFVGRRVLDRPHPDGTLPLPTDVLPAVPVLAAVALGLPLAATAIAALALRRVTVTPFGVVRAVRIRAPRPWPGILIAPGLLCFAVLQPLDEYASRHHLALPKWIFPVLVFTGSLAALVGVVLGTGWIAHRVGGVLHRHARRPAALLAGRRLVADPWSGSRTFAALLACVMFGGGAAGVRAWFTTDAAVQADYGRWQAAQAGEPFEPTTDPFYLRSVDLVDAAVLVGMTIAALGLMVALVEGIVARRRTYAALAATGMPRAVLARSILWQTLAPAVPALVVALAVGDSLTLALSREYRAGGFSQTACVEGSACVTQTVPQFVRRVPIPFHDLMYIGGSALLAVLAMTAVGLLFLRPSLAVEELRTT